MKSKSTLAIGIPAHNEEANIGNLLSDIAKQKISKANLEKVIVYSDGSIDDTVKRSKQTKISKLIVIDSQKRKGKATAINKIIESTKSDILVILDADTRILDAEFINKLILPIVKKQADLTSAKVEEFPPVTFVQRVLALSMQMKKEVFESYNKGNNLFTCHGRSRGFSRKMYRKFQLRVSASEDANSYLTCLANNMSYRYVSDATIYYQLPENFSDHKKQSIRFLQYKNHFDKKFGRDLVIKEYKIPTHLWIQKIVKYFFINPFYLVSYFSLLVVIKIQSYLIKENVQTWGISKSSKNAVVTQ